MNDLPCEVLVLASGNAHKVRELSELLAPLGCPLQSLADFPATVPVIEDGATTAENARTKASGYARQLGQWVLADDTALEVDALCGAPGVRSSRYAGDEATMADNRAKLLVDLSHVPRDQRAARFICHLAVADPCGEIIAEAVGRCEGRIRHVAAVGDFGFGYDCLFEVEGCGGRTLAELSPSETALVGHRGQAVRALVSSWGERVMGNAVSDF